MNNTETARLARQWAEEADPKLLSEMTRAVRDHILATTDPPTMADVEWDDEKHHLAGATLPNGEEVVMMWPDTYGTGNIIAKEGEWTRDRLTPNGKRYELVEVTDKPENSVEPSTKTMDEYTMAERADMVGMWAGYNRHEAGGKPTAFVIITGEENEAGRVPCYNPGAPTPHAWAPDSWMLTPRFDMPRAWSTDGDPCEPMVSSNENVGADQPAHPETLTTLEDYENAPEGTIVALQDTASVWVKSNGMWRRGDYDTRPSASMEVVSRTMLREGWGE